MNFGELAYSMLANRLAEHGYAVTKPAGESSVHFRSSAFDVVVYFDERNMDINARVRRLEDDGHWSYIRDIVADPETTREDGSPHEISPTPDDVSIRELGDLIERLPR